MLGGEWLAAGQQCTVLHSFTAEQEGDLSLVQGSLVTVLSHTDTNWAKVIKQGEPVVLTIPLRYRTIVAGRVCVLSTT